MFTIANHDVPRRFAPTSLLNQVAARYDLHFPTYEDWVHFQNNVAEFQAAGCELFDSNVHRDSQPGTVDYAFRTDLMAFERATLTRDVRLARALRGPVFLRPQRTLLIGVDYGDPAQWRPLVDGNLITSACRDRGTGHWNPVDHLCGLIYDADNHPPVRRPTTPWDPPWHGRPCIFDSLEAYRAEAYAATFAACWHEACARAQAIHAAAWADTARGNFYSLGAAFTGTMRAQEAPGADQADHVHDFEEKTVEAPHMKVDDLDYGPSDTWRPMFAGEWTDGRCEEFWAGQWRRLHADHHGKSAKDHPHPLRVRGRASALERFDFASRAEWLEAVRGKFQRVHEYFCVDCGAECELHTARYVSKTHRGPLFFCCDPVCDDCWASKTRLERVALGWEEDPYAGGNAR